MTADQTVPVVTVIIPARNEARDIEACLVSIAAQDHPIERLEVLVVDGGSEDDTAGIAGRCLARLGFTSSAVMVNTQRTTSSNLNVGLERATGAYVCRVDARTLVEPHYVRTCASILRSRPDVAVVGGAQIAVARDGSVVARGIARALNNRWAMGGSRYRTSDLSGSSDTVYLGAFRTADLRAVGGWDERLPTNQDFDLNRRMRERGLVWFEATLQSGYQPRGSLRELWQQYQRFGKWKVRYWRLRGVGPNRRQRWLVGGPPAAALLAVKLLRSRPGVALLLGGTGVIVIDRFGEREPAPARVRAVAVIAMAVVSAAWWTGVIRELVRGDSAG